MLRALAHPTFQRELTDAGVFAVVAAHHLDSVVALGPLAALIGGAVVAAAGPVPALTVDAVSFGLSALTLAFIRSPGTVSSWAVTSEAGEFGAEDGGR